MTPLLIFMHMSNCKKKLLRLTLSAVFADVAHPADAATFGARAAVETRIGTALAIVSPAVLVGDVQLLAVASSSLD